MRTKHILLTALVALVTLSSCDSVVSKPQFTYAPWTDLTAYFDLSKIEKLSGSNMFTFNSYEISQGRLPMTSDRLESGEYNAMILGAGVWMRSKPIVAGYTKRAQLNTGHYFVVTKHNFFANGRYWCYGFITYPGEGVYDYGYVCSDYVVSTEQFEMVQKYLFQQGSNLNYKTESKMLRAAADILLKFEADKRHPNLSVSMLNHYPFGQHTLVVYQIRNYSTQENNCMLAIVQFFNDNNDFVILGIVPGNGINQIQPNANGSYDVYFY